MRVQDGWILAIYKGVLFCRMARMDIQEYGGAAGMLQAFEDWLEENPAENNLLLGMLYRISKREAAGGQTNALCVGVREDGKPLMALLQTPPNELMLVCRADGWERGIEVMAGWMQERRPGLPGVVGPLEQAMAFARAYGPQHRVIFQQKTMRVDRLVMPRDCAGGMRLAAPGDAGVIRDWLMEFFVESLQQELAVDVADRLAKAKVVEKNFWVWEANGEVVSMAGVERPTRKGITVVLVYTPPQARRQGYASNLVAQITDLQLRGGRSFCCLHTDAGNATSNKIYREMGYYDVGEGVLVRFDS
jgi:uncharacterized protein